MKRSRWQVAFAVLLAAIMLFAMVPANVVAMSEAQQGSEEQLESSGLLNPVDDNHQTRSSDEEAIWAFLYGKIGNAYGTAGLMGNLYAESSLKADNLQNSYEGALGYTDETYTAAIDNGSYTNFVNDAAGYGLAQWTYYSRKQNLLNYAQSLGTSIGDLNMQLGFLWSELTSGYSSLVSMLMSASSVEEASTAVLTQFERPANLGSSIQSIRARYGQTYYDRYASVTSLTPSYTPSSYYRSSKYYTQLCNVSLTGVQRTDIINVALSQVGYHEGNSVSDLGGGNTSGSSNYSEYGYWWGTAVQGNSSGSYYAWCAYFVSWCARQAGIPESIIKNSACAGCSSGYFNLTYYSGSAYTPRPGDLFFTKSWSHVGIVRSVSGSSFTTIEGNCSDAVKSITRSISDYYFGVPNYSDSAAESSITISNYTYPTSITQGSSFYLTGIISSVYSIRCVNVGVYDSSNTAVLFKSIAPYTTTVNIATQIDSYIKFGQLSVGTYTYHIEASDINGYYKSLHTNTFTVTASGSSGSTDPTQYSIPTGYLNVGNSGEGVKWLQACLNQLGYPCDVDGQFGSGTASVLKQFQSAYGLTVDGGMGPEVRNKMIELLTCPTPFISNTQGTYNATVAISYTAGTFTDGCTVYYTIDGSTPTQSGYQYQAPFTVSSSCTAKAVAFKSCRYSSDVASAYVAVPDATPTKPTVTASVNSSKPIVTITWSSDNYNTTSFDLYTYTADSDEYVDVLFSLPTNQHSYEMLLSPGQYRFRVAAVNTDVSPYTFIFSDYSATLTVPDYVYTVTFKDWNGSVISMQSVHYGESATAPSAPTRDGYTFIGWDRSFDEIEADCIITAQYTINTYTVTFKDWDGTVLKTQTVNYGAAASAPADPTRVGYTFTGWDKDFDSITENTVVTAQYAVNSYTVTYYIDGEQYGTQTVEYGAQIEPPQVDVEGYTFSGWMLSDGSVLPEVMPAHDLEVFGTLTRNYVTVTYTGAYTGTAEVPFGGNAELPVLDAVGVHYTFTVNGEPWDGTALTEDVTVEVGLDINVYTVAFVDPVDGQTLSVQSVTHGQNASAPSAPQHYGYTFGGWDTEFTNVQSDLTVMAIYDPIEYTVIFMDGCDNVIETQSVPYLCAATAPADPVREGWTFTGWDVDFSCVEHALIVNATWSRNYYTVTFVGVYSGTVTVEHGADCELPVYNSSSVHYTFSVNGEPWDGKNVTSDVTVTVGVAVNGTYTVTFLDWDGSVIDTQQVAYGAAASAPADPSREGWTFAGWDKDFSFITADTVVTALYVENPTPEVKPGDVNGDGLITATDISVLFAYVMNAGSISDSAMIAADVNGDGEVNATDASLLAQMVFGA